jgi:hypothetical protein
MNYDPLRILLQESRMSQAVPRLNTDLPSNQVYKSDAISSS